MRGAQALGKYLEISRRKEVNVLGSPLSGRTATGIGRERASKGLLLGRGPYLATPTSARNAPSDTPGDRARAGHCVSELFCVRDDLAEIAAIKGRG